MDNSMNQYRCSLVDENRLKVANVYLPKIPERDDEIIVEGVQYKVLGDSVRCVTYKCIVEVNYYRCSSIEVEVKAM